MMARLERELITGRSFKGQAADVLGELEALGCEIPTLADGYAQAEGEMALRKVELAQAKEGAAETEGIATFALYGVGKIDGKNAGQRGAQVTALLAGDDVMRAKRSALATRERLLAVSEGDSVVAREAYKAAQYRLQALRAQADLLVALLSIQPTETGEMAKHRDELPF